MTVLTTETVRRERNPHLKALNSYTMASATTIYAGALVCVNGSGLAVNAADTSGLIFVGVAQKTVVNPSGGTEKIEVGSGHTERLAGAAAAFDATAAMKTVCCVSDNDTVDAVGTTTNDVEVGLIEEYEATDKVWVRIGRGGVNA